MRDTLVDAIQVPWWAGVRPNARGTPQRLVGCGFDVETSQGHPFALGWQVGGEEPEIYSVSSRTALPRLVSLIQRTMLRHDTPIVVVGAHALRFDLGALIFPHLKVWNHITARRGVLEWGPPSRRVQLEYCFGKVVFGRLHVQRRTALIFDTFRYWTMSLDRAAEAVGLEMRKLPKPDGLGTRRLPLSQVRAYLEQDTRMVTALVHVVLDWHRQRNLRPSVSVPQLAMRLFRHRYVRRPWHTPPAPVQRAAMLAFHAGRNGLYVRPGWYRVSLWDMTSAYPWAMTCLPSLSAGRWRRVTRVESPWGFYRLWGEVRQAPYPILFDHAFRPLPDGPVRFPVWVTGMEATAAIRAGALRDVGVVGYVWEPHSADRPLRDFVREMFTRRRRATSPAAKTYYKLLMNSLYGKFVSKVEVVDEEGTTLRAGSCYYPVAASWITGLVRVRLWEMERRCQALHSATDGVMAPEAFQMQSDTRLGGWKNEGRGWALILRNKFYLVFNNEGRMVKCAYHGFDGDAGTLVHMLETGESSYCVDRLRGWLEAAALGRRPFVPEKRTFRVSCSTEGFWPPPFQPAAIPSGGGWHRLVWPDIGMAG